MRFQSHNANPKQGKLSISAQTLAKMAIAVAAARPPPPLLLLRRRHRASSSVALAAYSSGEGEEEQRRRRPPHAVLGVSASASAAEARSAWRARALEVHPDVVGSSRSPGGGGEAAGSGGGGGEEELLELNEAYAAFLLLRGVRSRGAVGKKGAAEEEEDEDDDDPFLPPLFLSRAGEEEEDEERRARFLFVDPFSIPDFDPFRWRELRELLTRRGIDERTPLPPTPETAADFALASLSRAGVARMPSRQGVALLTRRQLAALEGMIESSLAEMDLSGGALAVSEALARARAANSGWRRPPRRR